MYIDWYCDGCQAELNRQSGFNTSSGTWRCTECGYDNDVTEDNVLSEEEAEQELSYMEECPVCGGHMRMGDVSYPTQLYICEDCGKEASDDGYGNLVY